MAEHFGSLALPVGEFLALEHGTGAHRLCVFCICCNCCVYLLPVGEFLALQHGTGALCLQL